jgi:hypothetical protein
MSPAKKLLGKDLERAVEQFQSEPDKKKAHERGKRLRPQSSVFNLRTNAATQLGESSR